MKRKVLTLAGLFLALIGSVLLLRSHAQPQGSNPGKPSMSTNWVGYLALGEEESMDQIARGPHPAVKEEVEIGLRSDGVVVWRPTSGKNFGNFVVPQQPGKRAK